MKFSQWQHLTNILFLYKLMLGLGTQIQVVVIVALASINHPIIPIPKRLVCLALFDFTFTSQLQVGPLVLISFEIGKWSFLKTKSIFVKSKSFSYMPQRIKEIRSKAPRQNLLFLLLLSYAEKWIPGALMVGLSTISGADFAIYKHLSLLTMEIK